jgi:replication-associated recombination protein RarA
MMPPTKNGLSAFGCISALQKYIRRGDELGAMQVAVEMMHSSKPFFSMICKRLEIISHEDIDTGANPMIVPFVATAVAQAREWFDSDPTKMGKSRMAIGNCIRLLARAQKSREGDYFAASVGWAEILEGVKPELPDWIYDAHTSEGRRKGRGVNYFREVSAVLVPPPAKPDVYQSEAFRLWKLREQRARPTTLFDEQTS